MADVYVDASVGGSVHDGTSWATACTDLQAALTAATAGTRILVAGGTYKPTSGTDRTLSFQLKSSVDVYGGYAGDLNPSNRGVRDPALYPTILSGDIGTAGDSGDNSYHVVRGGWVDNMTLSGFTITGGNANGSNSPDYSGGGMLNTSAQPTIEGCTFTGNSANWGGGGVYNDGSMVTLANCTFNGNTAQYGGGLGNHLASSALTNCTFSANSASSGGGGVYNVVSASSTLANCTFIGNLTNGSGGGVDNNASSPTLSNCTFSGNWAAYGGGMRNYSSSPTLTNCSFSSNTASSDGGGMYNSFNSAPTLTNCAFVTNLASNSGGGIRNEGCSATLINCTFAANSAGAGGGLYNYSSSPTLTNCILWGNTAATDSQIGNAMSSAPAITFTDIQGGYGGPSDHNISADPMFVRNPGPGLDGQTATADDDRGDLRLQLTSPAIDAGINAAVPVGTTTDLAGGPRFCDVATTADTGSGAPPVVDMGAYEVLSLVITGTQGNDTISASASADTLTITTNGSASSYPLSSQLRLRIDGLGGHDLITVDPSVFVPCTIYGGDGNDSLTGGSGPDQLWGGPGNDTISSGAGKDLIQGDAGNDVLYGGYGMDTLYGGDGFDYLHGGKGDDLLFGDLNGDTLFGAIGNDSLYGGNGHDFEDGGDGDDVLRGGNGCDILYGRGGNDSLTGGAGADQLYGGVGNDTLDAIDGEVDIVFGAAGVDRGRYDWGNIHDLLNNDIELLG